MVVFSQAFVILFTEGHAWQRGGACVVKGRRLCIPGGMHGRGACVAVGGMHGRRDGHCSGRYASYGNVFLFFSGSITSFHYRLYFQWSVRLTSWLLLAYYSNILGGDGTYDFSFIKFIWNFLSKA